MPPLRCLPLWGREGVTLTNSTEWIIQMISPVQLIQFSGKNQFHEV